MYHMSYSCRSFGQIWAELIVYFYSLHPFAVILCLGPNTPNSLLLFIAEKTVEEGEKTRRLHVGNGAYGVTHGNVCTPEGKQHTQHSWRCPPAAAEAAGHQRGREDPLGPSPSPNAARKGRRAPPVPPSGPAAGMEMAAGVGGGEEERGRPPSGAFGQRCQTHWD